MKTNTLDFDAQALREKILDLAMRGKLVPQDPNDEPASVLLEKIKAEKEQLIKEKKIKKSKPLAPITDDERPFDIPDSWEWVRLGDTANYIQRGRSPKYDKENKIYPIISQKCVQWNSISLKDAKFVTKEFLNKLESYRFVKRNDILWNSTGTGTVGRLNIVSDDFNKVPVDSHVTLIRTNSNINSKFIYYYLMSPIIQNNLNDYLTGTTKQKELGLSSILKVNIPLPPLSEQSRIAAKIAQLFALLRKVESSTQQYAKLQTLLKSKVLDLAMRGKLVKQDPHDEPASVLLEKIKAEKEQLVKEGKIKKSKSLPPITDDEKPFDIPDSWEWVRLGDVLDVRDGTHDTPKYVSEGIALVTAKNLKDGKIDFSNIKYISEKDAQKINQRSNVETDDILFAMIGTIGNPVLITKRNNFAIKNVALLKHAKYVNMDFVCKYILASESFLLEYANGGNQKFISLNKIKKLGFPLPPLVEQQNIVSKINNIFTLLTSI
ncbi:restriction endonuclease subunit S [Lactobacillus crispatus]|uniref:restriction endonuclease subunit S n=1 Tax=Lactobacillus crispatus TaxID=47770 RepID=UPI000772F187|nr:restriction endonuclease subunit S [Lactobacillus crispatus]